MSSAERLVAFTLILYLLLVGGEALVNLVASFDQPQRDQSSSQSATPPATEEAKVACSSWLLVCNIKGDRRILTQAFLAGIVGSFLHAAQSLTSYVGNNTFKLSWSSWYVMRPWIGGVLGLALAFAARAGLIGASGGAGDAVNVNGVVALGLLGGWFSKTTTDKLQEVFSTLFKTDADKDRTDKLKGDQPTIDKITPSPVLPDTNQLTITGKGFLTGAKVTVNDVEVETTFVSATEIKADLGALSPRPAGSVAVVVTNSSGRKPTSDPFNMTFGGPQQQKP